MKKTILTSILALIGCASAMASTFTSEHELSGANGGGYTGVYINMEAIFGSTADFATSSSDPALDLDTPFWDEEIKLDSLKLITRNDIDQTGSMNSFDKVSYLTITPQGSSESVTITSDKISINKILNEGSTTQGYSEVTISFGGLVIDTSQTYQIKFFDASNKAVTVRLHATSQQDSSDAAGFLSGNNVASSTYVPSGMTVVTSSIPEPTTATLSLIALAGLMARRRRQA